jgi:hypothetical protein
VTSERNNPSAPRSFGSSRSVLLRLLLPIVGPTLPSAVVFLCPHCFTLKRRFSHFQSFFPTSQADPKEKKKNKPRPPLSACDCAISRNEAFFGGSVPSALPVIQACTFAHSTIY